MEVSHKEDKKLHCREWSLGKSKAQSLGESVLRTEIEEKEPPCTSLSKSERAYEAAWLHLCKPCVKKWEFWGGETQKVVRGIISVLSHGSR